MRNQKPRQKPKSRKIEKKVSVSTGSKKLLAQQISWEAARILSDGSAKDYLSAKTKALEHLNLPARTSLPTNAEVDNALRDHVALFSKKENDQTVKVARELALEIMLFLKDFSPRLVGPVVSGILVPGSALQIHVFADTSETIGFLLQDHRIPFQSKDTRLCFNRDNYRQIPVYMFVAGVNDIEIYVFCPPNEKLVPLSPIDGSPMHRIKTEELEIILNESIP